MLGMFMVLPVLTTYGMALNGASEALIGIAIGIYGWRRRCFKSRSARCPIASAASR